MPIAETFIQLLTPFDCLFCGSEGSLVCQACQDKLTRSQVSRCYRCRKATVQHATCTACRRSTALQNVWVASELNEATQKLLYRFKFDRAQAAHTIIAAIMAAQLPSLQSQTIIIPVPTATSRTRRRGYDHTRLLAKEVARVKLLSCESHLVRLNQTRQVGATRQARHQQLAGAFRVLRPELLEGKNVLLIDDVLTTGATLEEAARTLKKAGAHQVAAVVFAHKV